MKVYVDENESPHFAEHINRIYFAAGVSLRTPTDEGLLGWKDIPLFEELQSRGFSGLITRDRNQLRRVDPELGVSEADKLHDCGLHWIGHTTPAVDGVALIAELTALYLSNWPSLVDRLSELSAPSAMRITRQSLPVVRAYPLRKQE